MNTNLSTECVVLTNLSTMLMKCPRRLRTRTLLPNLCFRTYAFYLSSYWRYVVLEFQSVLHKASYVYILNSTLKTCILLTACIFFNQDHNVYYIIPVQWHCKKRFYETVFRITLCLTAKSDQLKKIPAFPSIPSQRG